MKQFEANVTTVMKFLEDESFSTSVISEHRISYKKLHIYLEASGKCYTPEISLDAVCEQMRRTPPWMPGLKLRADGYECWFYKKD